MRLFRATPEATAFQRTGVAKTDRKSMPQKDPTRQDTTNKKIPFWTSKLLIFGAKRAFQKQPGRQERAHARIGSPKIASGALLDSLRGAKKTLVTSKSGLEKFLGRQEGDGILRRSLRGLTAGPPGRGRGGVGTPKKVTFKRFSAVGP